MLKFNIGKIDYTEEESKWNRKGFYIQIVIYKRIFTQTFSYTIIKNER